MALFKKNKNKSPFIFYSKDGKSRTIIYATTVEDEDNKSKLEFYLEAYKVKLPMRSPTCYIDGKGYREIAWNHNGELNYIESNGVCDKKYLDLSLLPEEKQLTLFRLKENRKRYDDQLNKWQVYMTIGIIIAFVVLIVGFIAISIQFKKQSENLVKAAQFANEAEQAKANDVNIMKEISNLQLQVITRLTDNNTVIRSVS